MKRIVILAVALFLSSVLSAQTFFKLGPGFDPGEVGRLRIGVTGGMNSSTISKPSEPSRKSLGGGLEALLPFSSHVYADLKALYSQKGFKFHFGSIGRENCSLEYVEVPLHLGYQIGIMNGVRLFAEAGPYLAYGFSYHHSDYSRLYDEIISLYEQLGVPYPEDEFRIDEAKERRNWNKLDFGLGVNAGVELFRYCRVFFGYGRGLKPIWKEIAYIDADNTTVNVNMHVGLSVLF